MDTHDKLFRQVCDRALAALSSTLQQGFQAPHVFEFDCASLTESYHAVDITVGTNCWHDDLRRLFEAAKGMRGPVLYCFEFVSPTDTARALKLFDAYRSSPTRRNIPARKDRVNLDTQTLYVGKVKRAFAGRLVTHLGYYKVAATQGLQLAHWAHHAEEDGLSPISLKLRLRAYEFDPVMADMMPLLEKALATELRPLLGKHR